MHNLRPALLHRDLKVRPAFLTAPGCALTSLSAPQVENILQSTGTKYKLCDFGSATPVATRPPSTVAEIQALGHDLDRHTTLQYRAPEMIDPNLRRPIDEKSGVYVLYMGGSTTHTAQTSGHSAYSCTNSVTTRHRLKSMDRLPSSTFSTPSHHTLSIQHK